MAAKNSNTTGATPHKVWGGTLAFGLVSIPVALFAAAREEKLSFNQLHSKCNSRLKQQPMQCTTCNTEVEKTEIVKGYEFAAGQFVTIDKKEIESAEPKSSRILEISEFVPESDVDPVYFESSFFLSVTDGGEKAYSLVRQAMLAKGVVAIAKLFYSGKEHVTLVRPVAGGLMLHTLFWSHEVRAITPTRLPEVSEKELAIAGQLVDALASNFDPTRYQDAYRANMLQLIEDKQAGNTVAAVEPAANRKPPVSDISAALFASIEQARSARVGGAL
ncbi:MAG TPA: Ku protein [Candidatus Angelobacter sp.]|jgi:DNA end-binding protein Ku|nr:Ku protein [Candidatus Angelobacter sp.]